MGVVLDKRMYRETPFKDTILLPFSLFILAWRFPLGGIGFSPRSVSRGRFLGPRSPQPQRNVLKPEPHPAAEGWGGGRDGGVTEEANFLRGRSEAGA